jgi:hypothetical protein
VCGTTGTGNNAANTVGTGGLRKFGEQIRGSVCRYVAPGYPKKASDYNAKPLKNLTLI